MADTWVTNLTHFLTEEGEIGPKSGQGHHYQLARVTVGAHDRRAVAVRYYTALIPAVTGKMDVREETQKELTDIVGGVT